MTVSHRRIVFAGLIGLATIAYISYIAMDQVQKARLVARQAAQEALLAEAHQLVAEYHAAHGHFPKTLCELRFTYPDGGDTALLDEFRYEPRTDGYRISVTLAYAGEVRTIEIDQGDLPPK